MLRVSSFKWFYHWLYHWLGKIFIGKKSPPSIIWSLVPNVVQPPPSSPTNSHKFAQKSLYPMKRVFFEKRPFILYGVKYYVATRNDLTMIWQIWSEYVTKTVLHHYKLITALTAIFFRVLGNQWKQNPITIPGNYETTRHLQTYFIRNNLKIFFVLPFTIKSALIILPWLPFHP